MKTLEQNVVETIVQFVNERSSERTNFTHKRDENNDVVVSLVTELQPLYCSPKGNKVATNNGYKATHVRFDAETGEILSFDSYINVGYGFEEIEFNGMHDLMPTYYNLVNTEDAQAW